MKEIEEGLHHVHAAAREKKKLADEHQTTNRGITVMFLVEIFFKGSQNLNPKLFVQTSWNFFFKNSFHPLIYPITTTRWKTGSSCC